MTRARCVLAMVVLAMAVMSGAAADAADTAWIHAAWIIDPAMSVVHFHGSSTLHDFDGTAKLVAGTLDFRGATATGAVVADAASMDTAESGRDKTMRGDTMAVRTWPTIRFDLTAFAPNADATGGTGTGTWTMHGVAKPITIPVTVVPAVPGAPGPHLHAHFVMDIRAWNIKPPRAMLVITVDPQVTVDLDLALAPAPAAAPATPVARTATSATAAEPDRATAPASRP